jgi:uncharacterized protein
MQRPMDRLILGTNIWISFLLSKDLIKIDSIIANREIELIISQALIDEIIEVTQRPKFKKYFDLDDVELLVKLLIDKATFIYTESIVDVCRDPKDNFLLGLAKDANATHLLTGDKDLLELKKFEKTKIIRISDYKM